MGNRLDRRTVNQKRPNLAPGANNAEVAVHGDAVGRGVRGESGHGCGGTASNTRRNHPTKHSAAGLS